MTKEQYEDVLEISGLAATQQYGNGDRKFEINGNGWKQLLFSIGMYPEDKRKKKKKNTSIIRPRFILSKTDNVTGFFLVMLVKQKKLGKKQGCVTQNEKKLGE